MKESRSRDSPILAVLASRWERLVVSLLREHGISFTNGELNTVRMRP